MVKDTIADFIIKLKNANFAGLGTVSYPYSKKISAIADLLQKEGYVADVEKKGRKGKKMIDVKFVYEVDGTPKINGVKRISKLSRRIYQKANQLKASRSGIGHTIISTSRGIMTDVTARKEVVGGEVLFKIW